MSSFGMDCQTSFGKRPKLKANMVNIYLFCAIQLAGLQLYRTIIYKKYKN
jgi:hypothetical protein